MILLILSLLLVEIALVVGAERLDDKECAEYGYNAAILKCSTCSHVRQVLGESDALSKCLMCCTDDKVEEVKYDRAVLEVDKRSLPFLPEISTVIKMKKDLNLRIKYDTVNPRLAMYKSKEDAEAAEVIPVHSWTLDTFKEYLQAHLAADH